MKSDVYTQVTEQIVAELEKGVKPWTQPWNATHAAGPVSRPLRVSGQAYRGINVLMLWGASMAGNYAAPIWMTYRQAQELGGQVRKGEKGSPVVYADKLVKSETDEATGEDAERTIAYMKSYTVFNVEQIDGLPAHFYARAQANSDPIERIADAESFFAATKADIRHGGASAYYSPASDHIQMPDFETFRTNEGYYATLAHEATHWTNHASRLDRDLGRKHMGDEGYAREELVAELGAAFLCADLGLKLEDRADHASYIASWLKVLKDDKRAIFSAAAHAQRAADYLNDLREAQKQQAA